MIVRRDWMPVEARTLVEAELKVLLERRLDAAVLLTRTRTRAPFDANASALRNQPAGRK